jgi:hypothetical protein
MRATIEERLITDFYRDPRVAAALPAVEAAVTEGSRSPFDAAEELIRLRAGIASPWDGLDRVLRRDDDLVGALPA